MSKSWWISANSLRNPKLHTRLKELSVQTRGFSKHCVARNEATQSTATSAPSGSSASAEHLDHVLEESMKNVSLGSRRRRAALATSANIPFTQLPFQCFQEARRILASDRALKIRQIDETRARIAKLRETKTSSVEGEQLKERRLRDMLYALEKLKIHADINDPLVKKRFEDGKGSMSKPIYRFLAKRRWESYQKKIIEQRISQFSIAPDYLPKIEVSADVKLAFGPQRVPPGTIIKSSTSEKPPHFDIQVFDSGSRLVTIAVVDADVPNLDTDSFDYRCHYLLTNVPISPASGRVREADLNKNEHIALPWYPPFVQNGDKYHRLAVFVLQQELDKKIDPSTIVSGQTSFSDFKMRSLLSKASLSVIGVHLFRAQWDEYTAAVMARAGADGAKIVYRREKLGPEKKVILPRKRKENRGGIPSKRL